MVLAHAVVTKGAGTPVTQLKIRLCWGQETVSVGVLKAVDN